MSSTAWDVPGTDGGGAAARLRAALATIRAGVDQALSTSTTSVEAAQLGALIGELVVEDSRFPGAGSRGSSGVPRGAFSPSGQDAMDRYTGRDVRSAAYRAKTASS